MADHIETLRSMTRHYDGRTKRATWTTAGRLFTGRGAPLRALAAARAAYRLHELLTEARNTTRAQAQA